MAKDAWARFRERDEKRLEEEKKELHEEMRKLDPEARVAEGDTAEKVLIELLAKCDVMMDQITNLYQMWIQGIERTQPVVQRRHLEDLVLKVQAAPKATTNVRFRISQFVSRYATFKDKWDRLLKDVETGKVKVKRRTETR